MEEIKLINLKSNFELSDANRVLINKYLTKIKKFVDVYDLAIQINFDKNVFEVSYRYGSTFICQKDANFNKVLNRATNIFIEKLKAKDKKKLTKIIKSKKASKDALNALEVLSLENND